MSALLLIYICVALIGLFISVIITMIDLAIIEDDDEFRRNLLGSIASDAATGDGPSITKAEIIPPGAYDGRRRL